MPKPRALLLVTTLVATVLLVPPAPATAAPARHIAYAQWDSTAALRTGSLRGVEARGGKVVMAAKPRGTRTYAGTRYQVGTWTSPWRAAGFGFTELIPSWDARTRGNNLVEVAVRGRSAAGRASSWDVVARWAAGDKHVRRTSAGVQSDDLGKLNVDTWQTASAAGLSDWQVRVTLFRRPGKRSPALDSVGAMASRLPNVSSVSTSTPGVGAGVELAVPRYSQMIHRGHYPQWGNGGQAWCSPTSTSMVLGYYDALPRRSAYSWVPSGHPNPWVDNTARSTYDKAYAGTGNWPFNTAYAATRTGHAFVTRLRSLREAELFIKAGIPLVASISFGSGDLDGAPIGSTNGHLVVIRGFTAGGNVIVNDPAASKNSQVRRVYDRGQFEDVWLPKSGGLVYVISDAEHRMPATSHTNW